MVMGRISLFVQEAWQISRDDQAVSTIWVIQNLIDGRPVGTLVAVSSVIGTVTLIIPKIHEK
jgi:hypothetical protein